MEHVRRPPIARRRARRDDPRRRSAAPRALGMPRARQAGDRTGARRRRVGRRVRRSGIRDARDAARDGRPRQPTACPPLTNLAHLDFLLDEATPPAEVPGHTTYRLAEEPTLVLPWTYADARPGGAFQRVGGGAFDAATGTGVRGRTTPTTSRVRPWSTCGTGR